jgi:hypothetical protein
MFTRIRRLTSGGGIFWFICMGGSDMMIYEAIRQVESSGNYLAVRFEPNLYYGTSGEWQFSKCQLIQNYNVCDKATARCIACTSFGAFQLLGVNIYDMGYTSSIFNYVNDAATQYNIAEKFFNSLNSPFSFTSSVEEQTFEELISFATKWNGPGNPSGYAKALQRAAGIA